jgi:ribonucleoside-diphosphate reductase alpha chain
MELTQNALKILNARYLLKDEKGNITETPEELFRRVARNVAAAEKLYGDSSVEWEDRFYDLMTSLKFLPNSPALMNAGKSAGQLAACFVLPVEDSMLSIFETLKNAALILQSGGGTGFSFSNLRPKNDVVRSTGGVASGPVSFMKIYNTATEVIKQGGARRGANMGILRVDHPDILDFIRVKRQKNELANFNISVAITDAFMDALKKGNEYELKNPHSGSQSGRIKAQIVFDEIVLSAWESGDPGLLFIDRINRANPTPHVGDIESTNPCGEQPLLPYEACMLGSLNLSKYVINGQEVDWDMLAKDIKTAVRFLDDSIDINVYPLAEIEKMHKSNRKIGLGVMGWADMLIMLAIVYHHKKAFELARKVMRFINKTSKEASVDLAKKRGVFPNFKGSIYDKPGMLQVRNATTTTIAPTGTLSTIADCSGGIEPIFALAYKRLVLDMEFNEINKYFLKAAEDGGFYSADVLNKVMKNGTLHGIKEVPLQIKKLFRTALEILPEAHIEMQSAFQEYTDNAVSKTINLPNRAKKEDVAKAFLIAYDKDVKGITIFRYGSKQGTMVKYSDTD